MATPVAKQLETVRAYETGNDIRQMVATSEGGRAYKLLVRQLDFTSMVYVNTYVYIYYLRILFGCVSPCLYIIVEGLRSSVQYNFPLN